MKDTIRRLIPQPILNAYHLFLAQLAAFAYGNPSNQLFVIGVTGTNGKSTTTQFIGRILEHAGYRVGWTTTVSFKVADREWINDKKMTMLGRFQTQKLLRDMVRAGCTHAVVETSSQGIVQSRHVGIRYAMAVFTNLTPEHIEAHGGFENYKQAKGELFRHMGSTGISVVNIDDPHADYFLLFPAEKKYGYGIDSTSTAPGVIPVIATNLRLSPTGSSFDLVTPRLHDSTTPRLSLLPLGKFNVYNVLAAIAACRAAGLSWEQIHDGVGRLAAVPGRLEPIAEGQPFSVIVDYAYEPVALQALYDAVALLPHGRLIHVLGSAGGGRDVSRRAVLGRMAAEHSDVVIVTNEDPYDDDPMEIIRHVGDGAKARRREGVDLFLILDRQEAIEKAVGLAQENDLVLITGKGSEPVMAVAHGKKIPWDDRAAVRRALHALGYATSRQDYST